jgi:hypothetical protein
MVTGGHAGLVAEPLVDRQGLLIPGLRRVILPPSLGQDPELVVPGWSALVVVGEQREGLGDEGGLGVPGPPLVQLTANRLGDLVCRVEIPGQD